MQAGIIVNPSKDKDYRCVRTLCAMLLKRNVVPVVSDEQIFGADRPHNAIITDVENVYRQADFVICIGGDGTFIHSVRKGFAFGKPTVGINLGTLGFMTSIEPGDMENRIDSILNGDYYIQGRSALNIKIFGTEQETREDFAINDVVVSRACLSKLLHLDIYIDDIFVQSLPGDGVVISTPSGSTAYSLSAGGPIAEPDSKLILVTPICPHLPRFKSYVVSSEKKIKIVINEDVGHDAYISADGINGYSVRGGEGVEITSRESAYNVINFKDNSFYEILRRKFS